MLAIVNTPLIRLGNLFPNRQVFAKCEFLAPSGSFKIHATVHLLNHLQREGKKRELVVPSMGNTALGVAVGARAYGFSMVGVVPKTISRAKDDKLRALGVELVKVDGGGTDVLRHATELAKERGAYFVHPHLDPLWTDGYDIIFQQIMETLPDCRTLVFPVGGGGLLMGLTAALARHPGSIRLHGCEAYNSPTYVPFTHPRFPTIAEGLILEEPHSAVQQRIKETGSAIHLLTEDEIRSALAGLYWKQALIVEPSAAITVAFVESRKVELEEPVCVILTGGNITRDDFDRLITLREQEGDRL
jgi:threonine dehydratase